MERTANLDLRTWPATTVARGSARQLSVGIFAGLLLFCLCVSAVLASWVPLQFSIVTVFLFAGPHNWFEFRYFLMRLPLRFGRSRKFFLIAFAGIGVLTLAYIALPLVYGYGLLPAQTFPTLLAGWNSLLLLWLGTLIWLRGKNKRRNWTLAIPATLALCSLNWLAPELFSLAIVFLHPLVALWFLDRHLSRTRPRWLITYRRCLCLVPLVLAGMFWQLGPQPSLVDDNGLFWRITQHAGAQLLPNVSSHLLVSTHVFLEMLHYGVWLFALPLIAPMTSASSRKQKLSLWNPQSIPLARHRRGFPRVVATTLAFGIFVVLLLWFGFSFDYATTRHIYFTVAIAHVLAEAPFLLKML